MNIALEVHLVFAFLLLLLAVAVGWVQMGQRVMVALIGIQVLIGLVVSAWAGMLHIALPPTLWLHIAGAIIAMLAYIAARRIYDRSGDKPLAALAMSLLGLVLLGLTVAYGIDLQYYIHPLRG